LVWSEEYLASNSKSSSFTGEKAKASASTFFGESCFFSDFYGVF